MCLGKEMLKRIEEFFDLVANEDESIELDSSMDFLRRRLEEEVDGWTNTPDDDLSILIQNRLEEIWNLISEHEKRENYMLEDYYEEIMVDLDEIAAIDHGDDSEADDACADLDEEDEDLWD